MCGEVEVPDVVQAEIRYLQLILCVVIVLPFSSAIIPVKHHAHGQKRIRTVNFLLRIIIVHACFFSNMKHVLREATFYMVIVILRSCGTENICMLHGA